MKAISLLKNILKNETGAALPAALALLLVGGLMVVPASVLTQTSLTANRITENTDKSIYTADAGIEYTLWEIQHNTELQDNLEQLVVGNYLTLTSPQETLNGKNMTITLANQGDNIFRITSTTSGGESNVAILSDIELDLEVTEELISSGTYSSPAAFDFALASLNGNITLSGNTDVEADEVQEGDIYANGNISLDGNAEVNGDAGATGTINLSANAEITGTQSPGAASLSLPYVDNTIYENETLSHDWGTITHPSGFSIPGIGDYENTDPMHVSGGDLNISKMGTIILGAVCVDAPYNIIIGSNSTVIFNGPVKVGGAISIASNTYVTFNSTIHVGGNFTTSGNAQLKYWDTVYVKGAISMSGNSKGFSFEGVNSLDAVIIAEGSITLTGNSQLAAQQIPFIMSTNGTVTLAGNNWTSAVIYAPNGSITLSGNSRLYGSAVGKSIIGSGNSKITYPVDLRTREDIPGGTTTPPVYTTTTTFEGGINNILTYSIQSPQPLQ